MNNPCRTCEIFASGNGYDDAHCLECGRRTAYVAALGPMAASVPLELSDIGRRSIGEVDAPAGVSAAVNTGAVTTFVHAGEPAGENTEETGMEEPTTKVCQAKDCEHGGRPQPLANFGMKDRSWLGVLFSGRYEK